MEPGTIIAGKFRVERVLGKGGMGTVVIATHLQLDQQVALKFLNPDLAHQPAIAERFLREARSSAKLRSDYACRVMDVSQLEDGSPYIVMELLDGEDLGRMIAKHPLDVRTAADYVLQACVAIAEAHAAGIVHRDLKPSNLMATRRLDGSPLIKVLDFGIATAPGGESKITQTASMMGSPAYMSPEQLRSARDVDARSDIWSLGVILYELVSGRLPFPGDSITEVVVKISIDPPLPLDVEPGFAAIVFRAIAKEPAMRFQTVAELAEELVRFASPAAATLAAVIVKLVGGARVSQLEAIARRAEPVLALQSTQPSVPPAPNPTTLTGSTGSRELAVARPRRTGVILALAGVVVAGAIGGAVIVTRYAEPTVIAIDAAVIASAPAPDAAPLPTDATSVVADADELAAQRTELAQLMAEHKYFDVADLGLSADDPVVGKQVAEAKRISEQYTRDVSEALAKRDCARAIAVAAIANNPTLSQLAHACVTPPKLSKPPPTTGSGSAATDGHLYTVLQVGTMLGAARKQLETSPGDAVAAANAVLADRPQNPEALAIATTGECLLRRPAIARRLWARLGPRQAEHGAVAEQCADLGIDLDARVRRKPRR